MNDEIAMSVRTDVCYYAAGLSDSSGNGSHVGGVSNDRNVSYKTKSSTVCPAPETCIKVESTDFLVEYVLPLKRRRVIFDGVVLPTLDMVRKEKREARKALEDYERLSLLKNPKLKKKKKNLHLGLLPETLRQRLIPIGLEIQDQHFKIDQITREVTVTRRFISDVYGGNMQATFPVPSKKFLDEHGMNDWMFLVTEFQPEAPQLPGAPGLWLSTRRHQDIQEKPFRVIVKVDDTSQYQFVGMYEVKPADPPHLTMQEYQAQNSQFHRQWAHAISEKKWGAHVCARILLRERLGCEPSEEQVTDVIMAGDHKAITPNEVSTALLEGREKMNIFTMKCVGYDNDFQADMSKIYSSWNSASRKNKSKPDAKSLASVSSSEKNSDSAGPQSNKRKRAEVDMVSDSNGREGFVLPTILRGTRSQPSRL